MVKATSRIGLPAGTKDVRLERVLDDGRGYWKLWWSYNSDMTLGTFLSLYDDGSIVRVTVRDDGESEMLIKPSDREIDHALLRQISNDLCMYDPRNPYHEDVTCCYDEDDPPPPPRVKCSCDNCFYGRDRLAVMLLNLLERKEP